MMGLKLIKHSLLKLSFIVTLMMVGIIPFIWLQFNHPQTFHLLINSIAQNRILFTGMRWLLIAVLAGYWPLLLHAYAKKQQWVSEWLLFWLDQRWRITGWLIVFEVLIAENGLVRLIKAFF